MQKSVLTDVDGVLLEWVSGFREWAKTEYNLDEIRDDDYDYSIRYGIHNVEARRLIEEFNKSAAIGQLSSFRDSVKYVKKMNKELGLRFHAITSMNTCPYAYKARQTNLKALFGNVFDSLVTLPCGSDKFDALVPYKNSGLLWIEDKPSNAADGTVLGLTSILLDSPYSASDLDQYYTTVSTWQEIYEIAKVHYADE